MLTLGYVENYSASRKFSHQNTFFFFVYAWPRPVHFSYLFWIDPYRREQRSHTKLLTHIAAAQTNRSWTCSKQSSTFSHSLLLIHQTGTLIKRECQRKITADGKQAKIWIWLFCSPSVKNNLLNKRVWFWFWFWFWLWIVYSPSTSVQKNCWRKDSDSDSESFVH